LFDNVSTIGGTRAKNTKTFAWTNNVRKTHINKKQDATLCQLLRYFKTNS